MAQFNEHHSFNGMQRDIDIPLHPANILYDAHNIRLTAREDDTLLAITNERGTLDLGNIVCEGTYLGHCLLNNYLVVFTTSDTHDSIYRIDLGKAYPDIVTLYHGKKPEDKDENKDEDKSLGFSTDHPIEAIGSYENGSVQKVYWTDNYNQPRVINIVPDTFPYSDDNPNRFDFIPVLDLNETVRVKKILGSGGEFAPGVIQYAFTYYYKYGQETNIFHITPLLYISYEDRGASPEDKVDNVFKITLEDIDKKFDYLRIYSIQRTSINATPFCKRVQDIYLKELKSNKVVFTDTGTVGDSVDPTELLYKGGENLTVKTLEQKDNTLFFGNLTIKRKALNDIKYDDQKTYKEAVEEDLKSINSISATLRKIVLPTPVNSIYTYSSQLNAVSKNTDEAVSPEGCNVPCAGFKSGETYRLGVQFQHASGKWSEPIFIKDIPIPEEKRPDLNDDYTDLYLPCFKGVLSNTVSDKLLAVDYKKIRPVVVFPTMQDRNIICQGVINPTIAHSKKTGGTEKFDYWSSWFFRPQVKGNTQIQDNLYCTPTWEGALTFTNPDLKWNPENLRAVEIQGTFGSTTNEHFSVERVYSTLHSPDIEFDEQLKTMDYAGVKYIPIGKASFVNTLYDTSIQTETPTISNSGTGFVHLSGYHFGSWGLVAGFFYDDLLVDDVNRGEDPNVRTFKAWERERHPAKFMVYPWQGNGSLNNDINRPSNLGVSSSELKKKVLSNLRYSKTIWDTTSHSEKSTFAKIFYSNEIELIRTKYNGYYNGNIDTLINPERGDGEYMLGGECIPWFDFTAFISEVDVNSPVSLFKLFSKNEEEASDPGLYWWNSTAETLQWEHLNEDIGDHFVDLAIKKRAVRIKYKSSPHIFLDSINASDYDYVKSSNGRLPIVELRKGVIERYGGTSEDALKANVWIPCGEPVLLGQKGCSGTATEDGSTIFYWSYGDTYFQRYDCLKTYAFTPEDPNQIVEIGSFMLETHTNIDGRYDRNRGQINNLNMSPQNFNLINPVYSQTDNFFSYRILDDDYYKNIHFPNQITWSKEKQAGADTDLWTNVTLASTYDIDGAKGEVVSLNTWRDSIYCFQRKGVSSILFNSRVQIPTSDNVPIEITNSYKVDGYRYLSDGVGCKDGRQIKETPAGIYFIDDVTNHLFQIGNSIADLTQAKNMSSWFRQLRRPDFGLTRLMYDEANKDLYLVNNETALCYSEVLGQFTSFMDYEGVSLIESYDQNVFTMKKDGDSEKLWQMFEGDYNFFFKEYKPWSVTFVSNGASNGHQDMDKIFTNIDYRMDMAENTSLSHDSSLDYMRVWNEYQDTENVDLKLRKGLTTGINLPNSILQKKFRIWRIQVPRSKGTIDRIRNTWCRITLGCKEENSRKAILHDLNVQYYT